MNRFAKIALLCGCFVSMPLLLAPRTGGGSYVLPAGNPVVSGTVISSTVHNSTMSDIATALTGSIAKDGQTTPSANLPMGSFRHTSVGDASARNQYGVVNQIQDGDYNLVGSVSGTNTIVGNLTPSITAYAAGMQVVLIPANNNTGATTLNLNAVGALDIQKGNAAALVADDLRAGLPALLALDTGGDDWILLNPASGNLGNVTVGTLTSTTINNSATVTAGTVASTTINNSGTATADVVAATTTLTVAGQSARDATNLFSSGTVPAARLPGSFNGFANPSATIGLTATNGSAATAMRSDGAPALSQAIDPTWTGLHTFTSSAGGGGTIFQSANPQLAWIESDGAADNKRSDMLVNGEQISFRLLNDAVSVINNWLTVDRTGTTVDSVAFPTDAAGGVGGLFRVGTANTSSGLTNVLAQIRTTNSTATALVVRSSSAGGIPLGVHSEGTSGNNPLITFVTDGASIRGSIFYNRGAGLIEYGTTSADNLKRNVRPSKSARGIIDCIPVVSHDWKDSDGHMDYWVTAGKLNKCAPFAVNYTKAPEVDGSVDVSKLVPAMIKYMQEQDSRIGKLEAQIQRMH